jgi:hypothetical protein
MPHTTDTCTCTCNMHMRAPMHARTRHTSFTSTTPQLYTALRRYRYRVYPKSIRSCRPQNSTAQRSGHLIHHAHRRPPAQSQASATRRVVARLSPSRGATSLELSSPTIAPFRIRRLLGAPARCAVVLLTLRLGHEHGQRPAVGGYLPYTYPPLTHLLTRPPVMGAARVPCMHTDSYLVQKRTPCVSLTSIR